MNNYFSDPAKLYLLESHYAHVWLVLLLSWNLIDTVINSVHVVITKINLKTDRKPIIHQLKGVQSKIIVIQGAANINILL